MEDFSAFKLNKQFLSAIEELGWQKPSPIQSQFIPRAIGGHDIIGVAETGTGKTAAYMLPILMKLKYSDNTSSPRALIIVPTKELALQVVDQSKQLAANTDLKIVGLYGGVGISTQVNQVIEGVDIVVSTPKRLFDVYKTGELNLKKIKTFVLDEADRLMDMGFIHQLNQLLEIVPRKRQNFLLSATFPERVEQATHNFLEFPDKIEIAAEGKTSDNVEQRLYHVPNFMTKVDLLSSLLHDKEEFNRVIVFTRTKETANNIYKFVGRKITKDVRLVHSNKGQNARINAMNDFKNGDIRVLVTTDVSARGIDVNEVSHVINFELPTDYNQYIHRIGRTGRADHQGIAISFADKAELMHIERIEKLIGQKIPVYEIPDYIKIHDTTRDERIEMEREIDRVKRIENPDFKGAFHEKKDRDQKLKEKLQKKGKYRGKLRTKL